MNSSILDSKNLSNLFLNKLKVSLWTSVLNVGSRNSHFVYNLGEDWVEEKQSERDLGIIVDKNFNFNEQCIEARNRANKILGFIKRNVSYKSKSVIRKLFNSYVRPHIEYCVQAWRPHHRYNIDMLESVQRRATKLIPALRNKPYSVRLKELNMFSVEYRFFRGDMIETYKILTGRSGVNSGALFDLDDSDRNRGHSLKLKKPHCRLDIKKFSFAHRVVDGWNRLPRVVVEGESINTFRSRLDNYMEN